jgi:hypothetical protein
VLSKGKHLVWFGVVVAACSIGKPPEDETAGTGDTETETASNKPSSAGSGAAGSSSGSDVPVQIDTGSYTPDPDPQGDCVAGATRSCGPTSAVGVCRLGKSSCTEGVWGECEGAVLPAARDCSSALDNDCDGLPDNSVDDTCRCVAETREPCGTHPGFDGHGLCVAGVRSCILSADKLSSDWGECVGSVAPGRQDSCSVHGDDTDCDGTPNSGCTCVEGDVVDCGPPANVGICVIGKSTCHNNKLGACVGAVTAKPRDCRSHLDNDCDDAADDDVDAFCTCTVGETRACEEHPELDGNGLCKPGAQICVTANNNATSSFGPCTGSVGPAARDCSSSEDNDCNGTIDSSESSCGCTIGEVVECNSHPSDGIGNCHAGTQTCIAGSGTAANTLGPCTGDVGPKAADICTPGDDANCNGIPNQGCPATP